MPETYLLSELQRRVARIEEHIEDLPAIRANAITLTNAVKDLGEEVKALRRAIVTAAVSFAVSSVLVAMSVLIAIRK